MIDDTKVFIDYSCFYPQNQDKNPGKKPAETTAAAVISVLP